MVDLISLEGKQATRESLGKGSRDEIREQENVGQAKKCAYSGPGLTLCFR
jgi:hypothetical protein